MRESTCFGAVRHLLQDIYIYIFFFFHAVASNHQTRTPRFINTNTIYVWPSVATGSG